MEVSEVKDEFSSLTEGLTIHESCTCGAILQGEMQYTDNILLMMLEQEMAEMKVLT